MSSSVQARLFGRVVVDHHDVLFLIRHHHIPIQDQRDSLVIFVLDAGARLSHTFLSVDFPRFDMGAIEQLNEHLAELSEVSDAESVIVCWCTSDFVSPDLAQEQLQMLAGVRLGVIFAGLTLWDMYWIQPSGFVSLKDQAIDRPVGYDF
jgi:hypothetical protein